MINSFFFSAKKRKSPSLVRALIKTFGPYYTLSMVVKVITDLLTFLAPLLLRYYVFTRNL